MKEKKPSKIFAISAIFLKLPKKGKTLEEISEKVTDICGGKNDILFARRSVDYAINNNAKITNLYLFIVFICSIDKMTF